MAKIDWNDPDQRREYGRNFYRTKNGISLDKPIQMHRKLGVDWNDPEQKREYDRNLYRTKKGISLDKPIRTMRKLGIDWNDPEQKREYDRDMYRIKIGSDPEYRRKRIERCTNHRLAKFGLTFQDQSKILASQSHRCLICKSNLKTNRFCVDHDHITGLVRGIICRNCNIGIGLLGDSFDGVIKAAKYLLSFEKPNSVIKLSRP